MAFHLSLMIASAVMWPAAVRDTMVVKVPPLKVWVPFQWTNQVLE
jgi:hypothetical protein